MDFPGAMHCASREVCREDFKEQKIESAAAQDTQTSRVCHSGRWLTAWNPVFCRNAPGKCRAHDRCASYCVLCRSDWNFLCQSKTESKVVFPTPQTITTGRALAGCTCHPGNLIAFENGCSILISMA